MMEINIEAKNFDVKYVLSRYLTLDDFQEVTNVRINNIVFKDVDLLQIDSRSEIITLAQSTEKKILKIAITNCKSVKKISFIKNGEIYNINW